ncbi:MAG: metallophosphoesterase [Clostridiales bacterium]|nr:metallophosphoesterase [Clostridiales bacterium]
MKILTIADDEDKYLWDYYQPGRLDDIDLILAAGDLDARYLIFLVTMAHCPLLYVHGNHDHYEAVPPEGCECIEDRIYVHNGVRILGLGGSIRYNPGPHQYTQQQMEWRCRRLWLEIVRHRGFDILLTHSPAFSLGDDQSSPSHIGFTAFNRMMERYQPSYMVHGHVHLNYGYKLPRWREYGHTKILNACGRYIFDYESNLPEK